MRHSYRRFAPFFVSLGLLVTAFVVFTPLASTSLQNRPIRRFEVECDYQHSSFNDPLKFPGQEGASHRHDFFGNKSTDHNSTGSSLLTAHRQDDNDGQAGCADIGDGAAYWAPSILMPDGTWKTPQGGIHAYYRAYQKFEDYPIVEFPLGFGMIAGRYHWSCTVDRVEDYDFIPGTHGIEECNNPGFVGVIEFPDCWDGINLFDLEGDHVKFRYPKNGNPQNPVCPGSHPVRIAELTLVVRYPGRCTQTGYMTTCTLSSGDHDTYHADFFNAFEPDDESGDGGQNGEYDKLGILIRECLNIAVQESDWCKDDNGRHPWPLP